ncbi:hypothetical protein RYR30_000931 [Flavobacterium psychrophilum]|nr:hypothetical protein [Flavobacterium psychrophilum]ELM3670993.1 hypothetical protein [Flavobacterium psychrophilum]
MSTLNGQISQHVEYIAFGEVLFEEHSSSFKSPYLFNGKELDRETNLSFYGARYLDMKTSLWLNVDPLAEKGPQYSPYCYAMNNPINLTDPDGRWPDFPASFQNAFKGAVNGVVNSVKQKYNEAKASIIQAKDNVVRTTNQALNNGQKFVKNHKEQLVAGAKIIQKAGDNMTTAGLSGAAIGAVATAVVGGEGAAPGLAVATLGGAVSTAGSVLEIVVKAIAGDEEATGDFGVFVATKATEAIVNKALPGAGKEASKIVKDGVKVTREIIKNEVSNKTKDIITEQKK